MDLDFKKKEDIEPKARWIYGWIKRYEAITTDKEQIIKALASHLYANVWLEGYCVAKHEVDKNA